MYDWNSSGQCYLPRQLSRLPTSPGLPPLIHKEADQSEVNQPKGNCLLAVSTLPGQLAKMRLATGHSVTRLGTILCQSGSILALPVPSHFACLYLRFDTVVRNLEMQNNLEIEPHSYSMGRFVGWARRKRSRAEGFFELGLSVPYIVYRHLGRAENVLL